MFLAACLVCLSVQFQKMYTKNWLNACEMDELHFSELFKIVPSCEDFRYTPASLSTLNETVVQTTRRKSN